MHRIFEAIVTGLAQGSMIALVALGYTIVYGVLGLINFAHGEVFMAAAYAGLFAIAGLGGAADPLVAGVAGTALAMVAAASLGMTIERVAYRPLRLRTRGRGSLARVTPLVTAIGCSVFLQTLAQLLFTARFRPYPRILTQTRPLLFVTSLVVMLGLELVVKRTWFGKSMRALSVNEEAEAPRWGSRRRA